MLQFSNGGLLAPEYNSRDNTSFVALPLGDVSTLEQTTLMLRWNLERHITDGFEKFYTSHGKIRPPKKRSGIVYSNEREDVIRERRLLWSGRDWHRSYGGDLTVVSCW